MSAGRARAVEVPAAHGAAIEVGAGEYLSIVDVEGSQVADPVALRRDDHRRVLSPHSRRARATAWSPSSTWWRRCCRARWT